MAWALGLRVHKAALLGASVILPLLTLGAVLAVIWIQRQPGHGDAVAFCEAVAAELRSGATLRQALGLSIGSVDDDVDLEDALEAPADELAKIVGVRFPLIRRELEATIRSSLRGGAPAAGLFDEIASLAIAQAEVQREVRIASSPARATAAVLVMAPAAFVFHQMRSGAFGQLLEHPGQRITAVLGMTLFLAGLVTAMVLVWRAR